MKLLHYSAKDVSIIIAGFYNVEGLAEDTFVSIRREVKPFDYDRAMDGEGARIYRRDDGYKLDLTVAQSSESNNVFSLLYNLDTITQMAKFPIIIKDLSGTTTFFGSTCWIEDLPEITFSRTLETRTWSFMCKDCILNIGGNDKDTAMEALGISTGAASLLNNLGIF